MKTTKFLAVAMAAAALLAGCTKGDEEINVPDNGKKIYTLEATTPDDSRTVLDGVSVKWADGDALAVAEYREYNGHENDQTYWDAWKPFTYTLTSGAGSTHGVFSSEAGASTEKLLAVYPASACRTGKHIFYVNVPSTQKYVANGIADDLLPMYAFTEDPTKLAFKHMASVLRIPVYADAAGVKVDKVTLAVETPQFNGESGIPTNGVYAITGDLYFSPASWGNYYGMSHQSTGSAIVYDMNNTELSADKDNPTVLNIVVAGSNKTGNTLKNLTLKFETADGRSFFKSKTSPLTVAIGTVVNFPTLACEFKDVEDVLVKVDDNEALGWSEYLQNLTVATESITVTTQNDAFMTLNQLILLGNHIKQCETPVVLNMAGAKYESGNFPDTFKYNSKLAEIYLPNNITKINKRAFIGCSNLTNPHLSEGLLTIEQEAFNNTPINPLYIPASVTNISYFILRGTTGDGNKAYDVDADNQTYKSVDGVLYTKDGKTLVEYPENNGWVEFRIPDGVETLAQYSLMESQTLKSVTLPASLTKIMGSAFQALPYLAIINCKALTGETIPTLGSLTYAAAGSTSAKGMYPGSKVEGKKVVYVPEGRADEFAAAWSELVTAGWEFSDGGIPAEVSGSLSNLGESSYDSTSFWQE